MDSRLAQAIIEANRQSFALQARDYDRVEVCVGARARQRITADAARIAGLVEGDRPTMLDCGAGTGNLGLEFLRLGFRVIGVDVSSEMLSIFRSKAAALEDVQDRLQLVPQDIGTFLDQTDEEFEVVGCCSFLHHLPDYVSILQALCQRVKPSGLLYVAWEPLPRSDRGATHRFLIELDVALWLFRHDPIGFAVTMVRGLQQAARTLLGRPKARLPDLVDFHVPAGLNVDGILQVVRTAGCTVIEHRKFSGRRTALAQVLADRVLHAQDHFTIIAQRRN